MLRLGLKGTNFRKSICSASYKILQANLGIRYQSFQNTYTRLESSTAMSSSAATDVTIELSPQEARFCDLLDEFAKEGRKKMKRPDVEVEIPEVECRIAGGWVRDKVYPPLYILQSTLFTYEFSLAPWPPFLRPRHHPFNMRWIPFRCSFYQIPNNTPSGPTYPNSLDWQGQCKS